jgi:hypothetical protein
MYTPFQKNYTVIEDIFPTENTDMTGYGKMGKYNSNRIIPAYDAVVAPPVATQYINMLEQQNPGVQSVNTPYGNVLIPRQTSFENNIQNANSTLNQYSQFTVQPPFAGGIPNLKNALQRDSSIVMYPSGYFDANYPPNLQNYINTYTSGNNYTNGSMPYSQPVYHDFSQVTSNMPNMPSQPSLASPASMANPYTMNKETKEPFGYGVPHHMMGTSGMRCLDIYDHVKMCPHCAYYFKQDNRIWIITLVTIVLVFCTIIYLLHKGAIKTTN